MRVGAAVADGTGATLGTASGRADADGARAAAALFDSGVSGASHAVPASSAARVTTRTGSVPMEAASDLRIAPLPGRCLGSETNGLLPGWNRTPRGR